MVKQSTWGRAWGWYIRGGGGVYVWRCGLVLCLQQVGGLQDTPFTYIDTLQQLEGMQHELSGVTEFAVDLEVRLCLFQPPIFFVCVSQPWSISLHIGLSPRHTRIAVTKVLCASCKSRHVAMTTLLTHWHFGNTCKFCWMFLPTRGLSK